MVTLSWQAPGVAGPFMVQRRGLPSSQWITLSTSAQSPYTFTLPSGSADQELRVLVGTAASAPLLLDVN